MYFCMVMRFKEILRDVCMNKLQFADSLQKKCNSLLNLSMSEKVVDILENHFIFTEKEMEAARRDIQIQLNLSEEDSKKIISIAKDILQREIKRKTCHPFGK